ncbi:MAG: hypothetical protein ACRC62_22120 [Microcoleus sp.]
MTDKLSIAAIWSSAVGMMALVGVFGRGNPVVMMVPPIAASATSIALIKRSQDSEDRQHQELLGQSERTKLLETRLENLEAIVIQDESLHSKQLQMAEPIVNRHLQ